MFSSRVFSRESLHFVLTNFANFNPGNSEIGNSVNLFYEHQLNSQLLGQVSFLECQLPIHRIENLYIIHDLAHYLSIHQNIPGIRIHVRRVHFVDRGPPWFGPIDGSVSC